MSKFLAMLTVVILIGLTLLAPRQYATAQSGAETPEPTATEPVMQIQEGLTLDTNYFETDIASPKLSIKLREPVLVGKTSAIALAFNKAADNIVQGIGSDFKD